MMNVLKILCPPEERQFPGDRWVDICLRTLHLVGLLGAGGGFFFNAPKAMWLPYWILCMATGIALACLYVWQSAIWAIQLRGIVILFKLLILAIFPVFGGYQVYVLIVVAVLSGIIAHARRTVRYFSILHGRRIHTLDRWSNNTGHAGMTHQWAALLDMSRAVGEIARIDDLERVVCVLFEQMKALGLRFAGLDFQRLIDAETRTFELHRVRPDRTYSKYTRSRPNAFVEWQRRQVLYRRDLSLPEHREGLEADYKGAYRDLGMEVRCILHVPNRFGLLTLRSEVAHAFSDAEVALIQDLTEMLGVGISRVEDLERLAAKNGELSRANADLNAEIAERKRVEETLRFTQYAIEHTADAAYWMGVDARFIYVNEAACRNLGYTRDELLSMTVHDIDPGFPKDVWEDHWRDLRERRSFSFEAVHRARDGREFPVEITVNYVVFDGREYNCAFAHNIAGRKQMEEELRKIHNLESLGILAGGIAHDFNNVLTGVIGNLALLERLLDRESEAYEIAANARKSADRTRDLTAQLMTFAKGGDPVKETASIVEVIIETADLSLSGSRTKPLYRFPDDLLSVDIDVGQIGQVIQNLVLNADHAMPEGGVLTLSAENVEVLAHDHLPLKAGAYVKVSVADRGIGIHRDLLDKIFDPYFSTKQSGHGLGLSIAHSIIQRHGGYITVNSELQVGTTFDFYLPASAERAAAPGARQKALVQGTGRILLMDDEEIIHTTVGRSLEMLGYEVVSVHDGEAALRAYRDAMEAGCPYDVAIMDLTIPGGMGGKEAVGLLREIDPDVRAIVSSGYATDPVMANYEAYGFVGTIGKPVDLYGLAEVVQRVLTCDDRENT